MIKIYNIYYFAFKICLLLFSKMNKIYKCIKYEKNETLKKKIIYIYTYTTTYKTKAVFVFINVIFIMYAIFY